MTEARRDIELIKSEFADAVVEEDISGTDPCFRIKTEKLIDLCRALKKAGYNLPIDVTAVDHSARGRSPRFELIYIFFSLEKGTRIRLKADIEEGEKPPSLTSVWKGTDWMECEVYDMMGIEFEGHPRLYRILNYESIPGFPLRKEFPFRAREVPWVKPGDPRSETNG